MAAWSWWKTHRWSLSLFSGSSRSMLDCICDGCLKWTSSISARQFCSPALIRWPASTCVFKFFAAESKLLFSRKWVAKRLSNFLLLLRRNYFAMPLFHWYSQPLLSVTVRTKYWYFSTCGSHFPVKFVVKGRMKNQVIRFQYECPMYGTLT